jgi:hypothetical protein
MGYGTFGINAFWEVLMRKKLILGAVLVLLAGGLGGAWWVVENDPVPYSWSCLNPDRQERSFCHREAMIELARRRLVGLRYTDPQFVRTHRERIESDFDRLFEMGFGPDEIGTDPHHLRSMLDTIERNAFGQGI